MRYYTVAELHIANPDWLKSYAKDVTRMVERHGGKYLARTSRAELWEGVAQTPSIFLVIEWPSRHVAEAFFKSEEYAHHLKARRAGSTGRLWLVPGEDAAMLAAVPGSS